MAREIRPNDHKAWALPPRTASLLLPDNFVVSLPCSFANHPSRRLGGFRLPKVGHTILWSLDLVIL